MGPSFRKRPAEGRAAGRGNREAPRASPTPQAVWTAFHVELPVDIAQKGDNEWHEEGAYDMPSPCGYHL